MYLDVTVISNCVNISYVSIKYFFLKLSVAIMMSQVMVCARQAVCSWGGFDLKPTFPEVIETLEYLGTGKKQSGVIFPSFKLSEHTLFLEKKNLHLNVNLHTLST